MRNNFFRLLALSAAFVLTGCATQYMPNWDNKRSGHFDKQCQGAVVCKSYDIPASAPGALGDAR